MKATYGTLWLIIVGAFLVGELSNLSTTYWDIPLIIGGAFMALELFCAFRRNGYTFSEFVWLFSDAGLHIRTLPVRVFPAWLLASAMALRIAGTARLIDEDELPYVFDHLPLDLFLFGVVVWLFFHFASGGTYRDRG